MKIYPINVKPAQIVDNLDPGSSLAELQSTSPPLPLSSGEPHVIVPRYLVGNPETTVSANKGDHRQSLNISNFSIL